MDRGRVPEEYFAIGTNVRAVPKEEHGAEPSHGTIIHIKELLDHMEYFVRFCPPKDQRLSDWYLYDEMEFVSAVHSSFKQPKVSEIRNIEYVQMGGFRTRSWYFSPYPYPFNSLGTLYVCPMCLKYAKSEGVYRQHIDSCAFTVPGLKIYDDQVIAVYEVDGRCEKLFCQFLCLFSKLFLDGKTLFYNTEIFVFYIMTVRSVVLCEDLAQVAQESGRAVADTRCGDSDGEIMVGYFSKEKISTNVLSCILTFPQYMRMGIGTCLMDFAYMLARMENRIGGPEEPLSDLGQQSFTSYWKKKIMRYLVERGREEFGRLAENELCSEEDTNNRESTDTDAGPKPQFSRRPLRGDAELPISDISYETAVMEKHIQLVCDFLRIKIRKDSVILSEAAFRALSKRLHRLDQLLAARNRLNRHTLNCKHLSWEPYPAMFV